jgi:hypothetical protein
VNTQANREQLAQQLNNVQDRGLIRQISAPQGAAPGVAGQTTGPKGIIYFYSGRSFFTGKLNGQPLGGTFAGLSIGLDQEVMIIHEFLHWTGTVGADNSNQRIKLPNGDTVTGSEGVSQEVRKKCL